jgi:hypothetical protein
MLRAVAGAAGLLRDKDNSVFRRGLVMLELRRSDLAVRFEVEQLPLARTGASICVWASRTRRGECLYAEHTDPEVAQALRATHWYELAEWTSSGPGTAFG